MKILFIEICNFIDYPLGGHLTFAKQLVLAMQGNMDLIGCTTNKLDRLRQWQVRNIEGYPYNIYYLCRERYEVHRPIIPRRITVFYYIKKYIDQITLKEYDHIIVQTPEVLFALPDQTLNKVCVVMPGVGNPLSISRYPFVHHLERLYDTLFFKRISHTRRILAAAGQNSIRNFEKKSGGELSPGTVVQFPTRYNSAVFNLKSQSELRLKYGYRQDATIFVTTGRLNWFKGWKLMLDAFLSYINLTNNRNCKFIYIGDGEDHESIFSYVNQNGLQDYVELKGQKSLSDVAEYLALSDEFIMGSYAEGWSTSLLEAVACGKPCVVTNFSSAQDMVIDGINGYVVKNRNDIEFAEKMIKALALPSDGIIKRQKESQRFSVANLKNDFLQAIGTKA